MTLRGSTSLGRCFEETIVAHALIIARSSQRLADVAKESVQVLCTKCYAMVFWENSVVIDLG